MALVIVVEILRRIGGPLDALGIHSQLLNTHAPIVEVLGGGLVVARFADIAIDILHFGVCSRLVESFAVEVFERRETEVSGIVSLGVLESHSLGQTAETTGLQLVLVKLAVEEIAEDTSFPIERGSVVFGAFGAILVGGKRVVLDAVGDGSSDAFSENQIIGILAFNAIILSIQFGAVGIRGIAHAFVGLVFQNVSLQTLQTHSVQSGVKLAVGNHIGKNEGNLTLLNRGGNAGFVGSLGPQNRDKSSHTVRNAGVASGHGLFVGDVPKIVDFDGSVGSESLNGNQFLQIRGTPGH